MRLSGVFAILVLTIAAPPAKAADNASSAEDLVKQVLAGLEVKDEQRLKQLTINQAEFKKFIWPMFAANVAKGISAEAYYLTYVKSSEAGLSDRLKSLGGQKWDLVKVSLGPERKGKGYRILPRAEATVRSASGEEKTVAIAGAVLDQDGAYKIATYYVREVAAK